MARISLVRAMLGNAPVRSLAVAFTTSVALAATMAAASTMLACGRGQLPAPSYVGQPQEALVQVPYPPPPARVEFVPDSPDGDAVWVDGEWVWQGRRYAWKPGRWVRAPSGAAFAPWATVRDSMGGLYIAEGTWRDRSGKELKAPEPLRTGRPSPGAITDPEGETINAPAIQPADASTAKTDAASGTTPGRVTEETRAPRDLATDAGLPFEVDAAQLPDGGSLDPDSSVPPFDASFDGMPARIKKP